VQGKDDEIKEALMIQQIGCDVVVSEVNGVAGPCEQVNPCYAPVIVQIDEQWAFSSPLKGPVEIVPASIYRRGSIRRKAGLKSCEARFSMVNDRIWTSDRLRGRSAGGVYDERGAQSAAEGWLQVFEDRPEGSGDLAELPGITEAAIALFVSTMARPFPNKY